MDENVLLDQFLHNQLDKIKTKELPRTSNHSVFLDIRGITEDTGTVIGRGLGFGRVKIVNWEAN